MKRKPIVVGVLILTGLFIWNIAEFPDYHPDQRKIKTVSVPESDNAKELDWKWFDRVKIHVRQGECTLVSLPDELENLNGEFVTVSGASFACGDDIIESANGYTIRGFILVPYFGMIDCCIGNPVPYFQWTIVVKKLRTPWQIHHKGIIDPTVAVRGIFRVERGRSNEGIFFLDDAYILSAAEDEAENHKKRRD
jgi:hypothetical protein